MKLTSTYIAPPSPANHPRAISSRAFTLIETTLAIGLTAVGLVVLMALIPHGLNVMKTAGDTSVEARIAQELTGEVLLTDWTLIDDFNYEDNSDLRYFDVEGTEVYAQETAGRLQTPDFETRVAHVAQILIPEANSNEEFQLPSGGGSPEPDPDLKRVIVRVANVPIVDLDFEDERYRNQITTYTTSVVKMLRDKDQLLSP